MIRALLNRFLDEELEDFLALREIGAVLLHRDLLDRSLKVNKYEYAFKILFCEATCSLEAIKAFIHESQPPLKACNLYHT